jgi:hypothetical protein
VAVMIFSMSMDIASRLQAANDKVDEAIAADEGGNSSRALQLIDQAMLLIAMVPDSELEEESFSWDREALAAARAAMSRRAAAGAGIRTMEIRYARESH